LQTLALFCLFSERTSACRACNLPARCSIDLSTNGRVNLVRSNEIALPREEQNRQLDEASRRLLDGTERLLALEPVGDDHNNDATLRMIRRTKELVATGMPFSKACAKAMEERDALLPFQLQSFAQRRSD
jgi:hypothetical protein